MVIRVTFFLSTKLMELNDLNVNNVLDEIRPYIEADGGYLEYVAIDILRKVQSLWYECWVLVLDVL